MLEQLALSQLKNKLKKENLSFACVYLDPETGELEYKFLEHIPSLISIDDLNFLKSELSKNKNEVNKLRAQAIESHLNNKNYE